MKRFLKEKKKWFCFVKETKEVVLKGKGKVFFPNNKQKKGCCSFVSHQKKKKKVFSIRIKRKKTLRFFLSGTKKGKKKVF